MTAPSTYPTVDAAVAALIQPILDTLGQADRSITAYVSQVAALQAEVAQLALPKLALTGLYPNAQTAAAWAAQQAAGFPLELARVYEQPNVLPATWADSAGAHVPAGVSTFISYKPDPVQTATGANDSWLRGHFATVPAKTRVCFQHEADDPKKGITPAAYGSMWNHAAAVVRSVNPGVILCPVPMGWQMRLQGSAYGYLSVLNPDYVDEWWPDCYTTDAGEFSEIAAPVFGQLDNTGVIRPKGCAEFNAQPSSQTDLASWALRAFEWLGARPDVVGAVFYTGGGHPTPQSVITQLGALLAAA